MNINVDHVTVICHLEGWSELWHSRRVKVVGVALVSGLGEHPELVLVELGRDQRGHHREHSLVQSEVSIWLRIDQSQLTWNGRSASVAMRSW